MSDAAMAREVGGSAQRIAWWRRRLRENDARSMTSFVEVRVAQPEQTQPFVIGTQRGMTVMVWPGFDEEELGRLLAMLGGGESC